MKEKKTFSYLHALFMSFYSSELYVDIRKNWRNTGMFYLLFLCMLVCVPTSVKNIYDLNHYFNQHVIHYVKQIPDLKIKDGVVSSRKVKMTIKDKQTNQPFIIVDTTGEVTSLEQNSATVLITSNQILTRLVKDKLQTYDFDQDVNGVLTSDSIIQTLTTGKNILLATLYPGSVLMLFIALSISIVLFSLVGLLMSSAVFKYKIKFKQSLRLACVAVTPGLVLLTLFYLLGWTFSAFGFFMFIMLMIYYLFAVYVNKQINQQLIAC